jgi:hypothetical protein
MVGVAPQGSHKKEEKAQAVLRQSTARSARVRIRKRTVTVVNSIST